MTTTTTENSVVTEKTRELCEAIAGDPAVTSIRKRMDTFMADNKAREQYETVMAKGQALNEKQQKSLPLSGDEISDFEKHREQLLGNPVARGFLDAQEEMNQLQHTIQEQVAKTLELGRVPTADDMDSGSAVTVAVVIEKILAR